MFAKEYDLYNCSSLEEFEMRFSERGLSKTSEPGDGNDSWLGVPSTNLRPLGSMYGILTYTYLYM